MRWLATWKTTPSRQVSALVATAIALFVVAAVALAFNLTRLRESFGWVEHTNEVLRNISSSERALLEAESSERGYLLTARNQLSRQLQTLAGFFAHGTRCTSTTGL
jgi:CHASE3 domain sensor protein